jgi:glycosyltransferase involved in cell wall biosynthesis
MIPVPPQHYGGIERIVFMLIKELSLKGHDITLYAHRLSNPGCKLVPYQENEAYNFVDLVKINLLTSKIALGKFDLVHTFGRMSNIALLMLAKIPKVVSYQLPPTLSQVVRAGKIARANTLQFTACSNYIAGQLKPYGKVTTIYNGVDINDYHFNDHADDDAPLVFLGRIQQEKGTDIAIQVAKRTGRRLIIAGNVPAEVVHQRYFRDKVQPHIDVHQVAYIGPVNNRQKDELLGNAAALLMPVTWAEPFGIVMAEALACGTPVIGFNKGAVPEVVVNGLNGFVCDTLLEMAEAVRLLSLIERSNCRRIAEEKFSATVLASQYERLYQHAINKC